MTGEALFTPKMIDTLRNEYAKLKRIDPDGDGYKNLTAFLDKLPQPALKQLAEAEINFLSLLARNRIVKTQKEEARLI